MVSWLFFVVVVRFDVNDSFDFDVDNFLKYVSISLCFLCCYYLFLIALQEQCYLTQRYGKNIL
jgi:hypothetical protein